MIETELMTLLEIQDLRSKLRELESGLEIQELETEHFHVDVPRAVAQLTEKVGEMESLLQPAVRRRYDRIKGRLDRVVVPVIGEMCYGCYTAIAASAAAEGTPTRLQNCESCGRFIYVLP